MKYYLVKLTTDNVCATLKFESYSDLRRYLREMLASSTESIVAIYIGL